MIWVEKLLFGRGIQLMIDKCPQCNEKIDILPEAVPITQPTGSTFQYNMPTTIDCSVTYSPTTKTYKCANPKCWVTKINESWQ